MLSSPTDFQIIQRNHRGKGTVTISGPITPALLGQKLILEVRRDSEKWMRPAVRWGDATFTAQVELPAGGWYALEVRFVGPQGAVASTTVEHVGVGEIFVVAGQQFCQPWRRASAGASWKSSDI
jgi:hypothetical protein